LTYHLALFLRLHSVA